MSNCLDTLNQLGGWADDLEVEALPSVRSATVVPATVFVPWWVHGPLTTVLDPSGGTIYQTVA